MPIISSTRLALALAALAVPILFPPAAPACLRFKTKNMQQHIFQFVTELDELQNTTPPAPSSHCSSAQERLVKYGSEALDTVEHLGLVLNDQSKAVSLLEHFGSVANLTRASVQDLLGFVSPAQAAQLVCALRLAAVALREERSRLLIDTPLAVADLCEYIKTDNQPRHEVAGNLAA